MGMKYDPNTRQYVFVDDAQSPSGWDVQALSGGAVGYPQGGTAYSGMPSNESMAGGYGGSGKTPLDISKLSDLSGGGGNPGLGMNMGTLNAGISGIQALSDLGGVYLGMKQLGLAKDTFKFQKQAYATNLANQTSAYNTQMSDRVAGRNYATEEERQAALRAAQLPAR